MAIALVSSVMLPRGVTDPDSNGFGRIAHAGLIFHTVDGHAASSGTIADNADSYMSSISWAGDPGFALARIP